MIRAQLRKLRMHKPANIIGLTPEFMGEKFARVLLTSRITLVRVDVRELQIDDLHVLSCCLWLFCMSLWIANAEWAKITR